MHYTHCIKQDLPSIYHSTIKLDVSLHSAVISRLEEESESKRENVVIIREREGKKHRESIMYQNLSFS